MRWEMDELSASLQVGVTADLLYTSDNGEPIKKTCFLFDPERIWGHFARSHWSRALEVRVHLFTAPGRFGERRPRFKLGKCRGRCRGRPFVVKGKHDDDACRCSSRDPRQNIVNLSTACQCVTQSSGVFFTSCAIRKEALWHFWRVNTFMAHGTMATIEPPDGVLTNFHGLHRQRKPCVWRRLSLIPADGLKHIRRLIIDTDWSLEGLDNRCAGGQGFTYAQHSAWGRVMRHLSAHAHPELQVEVRQNRPGAGIEMYLALARPPSPWGWSMSTDPMVEEGRLAFARDVRKLRLNVKAWRRCRRCGDLHVVVDHKAGDVVTQVGNTWIEDIGDASEWE